MASKSMLMGFQLTKGCASSSVSVEVPSKVASQSEVREINVGSLTALPDASSVTSQCIAATELHADPDPDADPGEVKDDSTVSAGGADGSPVHPVLDDVSLPVSIMEI